jgi:hypothetical protein
MGDGMGCDRRGRADRGETRQEGNAMITKTVEIKYSNMGNTRTLVTTYRFLGIPVYIVRVNLTDGRTRIDVSI